MHAKQIFRKKNILIYHRQNRTAFYTTPWISRKKEKKTYGLDAFFGIFSPRDITPRLLFSFFTLVHGRHGIEWLHKVSVAE